MFSIEHKIIFTVIDSCCHLSYPINKISLPLVQPHEPTILGLGDSSRDLHTPKHPRTVRYVDI